MMARRRGRASPGARPPLRRLVAFLLQSKQEITDQALEMHDLLIGRLFNRSEHRQQERLQQNTRRSIHENLRLYTEVGECCLVVRAHFEERFLLSRQHHITSPPLNISNVVAGSGTSAAIRILSNANADAAVALNVTATRSNRSVL